MINTIKNADKLYYIRCQWRVWKQYKQVYVDVPSKKIKGKIVTRRQLSMAQFR